MQINIIWVLSSRWRVFWNQSLVLFPHVCLSNTNTSFSGAHWLSWTNRSSRTQGRSWRTGKHSLNLDWDTLLHQFDSFNNVQRTTVPRFSSERTSADSHMFDLFFFVCACLLAGSNKCIWQWFITVKHAQRHRHTDRCSFISSQSLDFMTLLSKYDRCSFANADTRCLQAPSLSFIELSFSVYVHFSSVLSKQTWIL